jgi:hypothetical protein
MRALLLPALVLAACEGERPPLSCPRAQIEEIIVDALADVTYVARVSGPRTRGLAHGLPGVSDRRETLALLEACTAPAVFDIFCAAGVQDPEAPDPFLEEHDRCLRLGCEAAGVGTIEVYWTMRPHTAPDEVHAFSYETPVGTATMDPNPRVIWRVDLTGASPLVTADLSRALLLEDVDLGHAGTLSAQDGQASLELAFPARGLLVTVDDGGGAVTRGGETLATITGGQLMWAAGCP